MWPKFHHGKIFNLKYLNLRVITHRKGEIFNLKYLNFRVITHRKGEKAFEFAGDNTPQRRKYSI